MAQKRSQTFATHKRFDPLFHFFALPVFAISVIPATIYFVWRPGWLSAWIFLVSVAAAIAVLKLRLYALRVQDRIIRLEERLRLAALLSEPLCSRIPELIEGQLVAIRFASDAEVPALVERALAQNLSRTDIKKAIQTWRPDYWRV